MEAFNNQQKSVFGTWWVPVRKWFYPAWLIYETSIRFYEYAFAVGNYFIDQGSFGELFAQILAITCGLAAFLVCIFYLTIPACIALYAYFKDDPIMAYPSMYKIKKYF
jgi:hypothetical protein